MAVDEIVHRHGFSPYRKRFQGLSSEGTFGTERALALKPMTYMNCSGDSVSEAMQFYKLTPDQVMVFHDELDLEPGRLRMKRGGGIAGHNGLRSIAAHIGADFRRCRIGIGHPGDKALVAHYVLQNFAKSDTAWLRPMLNAIAEAAPLLSTNDAAFASKVALILNPPRPSSPAPEKF